MADIFISYSSKDKEKADQLSELLASAGLSVWIDQSGIDVATSWSKEIVDAIDGCKAFVLLLSPNSIASENVIKEISLAAERKKKFLPLDLEPVTLPNEIAYHLAGIQRAPMTNIDAIIRALGKLGLEATQAPTLKIVKESDLRKSLMILPFEDLSPTGDNQWFADGIVSEMIAALSHVKALRVIDQQTTKEFKNYKGHLTVYAKEMGIRYFVQGSVRKFGDQIKIASALLDIESGDHLWQDSLKGTMDDIFDIQEKVAEKVVEGLKVHLASDEKKKLGERGTENAEAYELFLKGSEYFARQTKEGFELAIQLNSEAINLDPEFAKAYAMKANALASLYRSYRRDPKLLEEGLHLITEALRLKPDFWGAYGPLSIIYTLQGKPEEAERTALEFIRNAPEEYNSYFALGFFYSQTGQPAKAIAPYEQSLKLKPEFLAALFNICICCNEAKESDKLRQWSEVAIPLYQKHLKLFPDDENKRVSHADLLYWSGRAKEARETAQGLENLRDGRALFNTACLHCMLGDYHAGLRTFRKAIGAGFRNMRLLREFLNDEENIGTLKGTPEWEAARLEAERLEAEGKANG